MADAKLRTPPASTELLHLFCVESTPNRPIPNWKELRLLRCALPQRLCPSECNTRDRDICSRKGDSTLCVRGSDKGYRAQVSAAEATPVILDRASCPPHLEEQNPHGSCTDTQAGQFLGPRCFRSAVYPLFAQLTRSNKLLSSPSGPVGSRASRAATQHVTAVPECEYIEETSKDIRRTSRGFHYSTVSQHYSVSSSTLD